MVGCINFGDHIGDLEADPLKFADRLAELFPFRRIIQRIIKTSTRTSYGHGSNSDACGVKPCVHHLKPAINLAQNLGIWQAAIIKFQHHVFVSTV